MSEELTITKKAEKRWKPYKKSKETVKTLSRRLTTLEREIQPEWKFTLNGVSTTPLPGGQVVLWDLLKNCANGPDQLNGVIGTTIRPKYLQVSIELLYPVGVGTAPVRLIIGRVTGDISDVTTNPNPPSAFLTKYFHGGFLAIAQYDPSIGKGKGKSFRVIEDVILQPDPYNFVLTNTGNPYTTVYNFQHDLTKYGTTEFEAFAGASAYSQFFDGGYYMFLGMDPNSLTEGNSMQFRWSSKISYTDE